MKKIMFNDKYSLNKAVLEGRKTNTRRAIKLKVGEYVKVVALDNGSFMSYVAKEGKPTAYVGAIEMPDFVRVLAPKYFIGEEVAIAQQSGYRNKMFVKAHLMPHRIKITNIRIERLQNICDSDCLKEGIICKNGRYIVETYKGVVFYTTDARQAFAYLIDKVSGKGTWDSNPYVFVYDFELVKKLMKGE